MTLCSITSSSCNERSPNQNAVLIIKTEGMLTGRNPVTCAPIFASTEQRIPCKFEAETPSLKDFEGVDKLVLNGYIRLKQLINNQASYSMELILSTGELVEGVFYALPHSQSNLGLESYFGYRIHGTFRSSK